MVFCRRRMMENSLANGLVIYLIVPKYKIKKYIIVGITQWMLLIHNNIVRDI